MFSTRHQAWRARHWPRYGLLLALLMATGDVVAGEAPLLTIERAVAIALEDNPGLAEIGARANAAAVIPAQRGALPDPSLSLRAQNLPVDGFDLEQEPMTQLQFGLSQAFPFPGKLRLRENAARHNAEAARARVDEARLGLVRDVQAAWWELFYLDRAQESVRRNQELLRGLVEIARTKYEVGQGLQQDVLLAEVELSKLLDQTIGLTGARRAAAASLNALLDQPTGTAFDLPEAADPVGARPAGASQTELFP